MVARPIQSAKAARLLPAAPAFAAVAYADLAAFRCIDAIQANPLAVDLDRIAVNDRGDANQQVGPLP
jgi:hypothetical protein